MRLERVLDGNLCLGCGLCTSVIGPDRAQMDYDADGYLRPVVSGVATAQEEDLIDLVCPGGRLDQDAGHEATPVWGPIIDLYSGWAADDEVRFRGASGGALTALLDQLLATGEADYVLHVVAAHDPPWLNAIQESAGRDEVVAGAGSRYAPSAPLADIVQRLAQPGRFVFVGKPCDVAALRMYSRHDPLVSERVVAMVSFMCAGVPSEAGLMELLERMGAAPDEVAAFRFRGHGWPGRATATLHSGEQRTLSYAETWGGVLSRHTQPRCKLCPDGEGVFADIVFADAWETDDHGYPTFEELDGKSLVMSRTPLGSALLQAAVGAGRLRIEPLELEEVESFQQHQARRTRLTLSRVAALALLGRPFPRYRGLQLWRAAARAGLFANVKSLLGTVRRALRGRV